MTKKTRWLIVAGSMLGLTIYLSAQTFTPLTPLANLRGRTDGNGAIIALASAAGVGQTPLTPFPQLQTRTDSNGALNVTIQGGTVTMNAGSGTATYKPSGIIYKAVPAATNSSTTNYSCQTFTALPASTLVNSGDLIHVRVFSHSAANATNKTVWIRWNYTSCANDGTGFTGGTTIQNNTTALSSATIITDGYIWRSSLNNQAGSGTQFVSGNIQGTAASTAAATETSAINYGMAFSNATANDLTIDLVLVEFVAAN